jgi:predicted SprT family Zn-dependent metalloprotease
MAGSGADALPPSVPGECLDDLQRSRSLAFISLERLSSRMSPVTYSCPCGATLQFKQDLTKERGDIYPTWKCIHCGIPVPGQRAEQLRHQHPS